MAQTYLYISRMTLKVLIQFPITYEFEASFWALLAMKQTARNWFDAIHDMKVALSKTEPSIA